MQKTRLAPFLCQGKWDDSVKVRQYRLEHAPQAKAAGLKAPATAGRPALHSNLRRSRLRSGQAGGTKGDGCNF